MNLKGILDIVARSDAGRARSENEDVIEHDAGIGVAILADGMGGASGGEIASRLAVDTILGELRKAIPSLTPGEQDVATGYSHESLLTRRAIIKANALIYRTAQEQPEYFGMGTTVVVGMFYDNRVTIAHVGDSRMYRYRDGQLEQITVDHSLMQELVDHGFYTPEEARRSMNRNLVTRALGIEPTVAVDMQELPALPDDIYMFCSDGLNDMIEDQKILLTIKKFNAKLDDMASRLIEMANENGGRDNVSVILARPTKPFPGGKGWREKFTGWLP